MLIDTVEIEHKYDDTIYGYSYHYGIDALTYFSYQSHLQKRLARSLRETVFPQVMIGTFNFQRKVQERLLPRWGRICL